MAETQIVTLANGNKVVLEDDDSIFLSLISNGKVESTFQIPYPSGGYGGGMLLLSPSEQYLIFSYFSGESEEAFLLFGIENGNLEPLYDSGYIYGEEANYCFLSEDKFLLQTLRTDWWYPETEKTDENGDKFYEFGQINILNIETKTLDRHIIHVYPSDDWEEEITDNDLFLFSEMINDNSFNVTMPWGKETFHYPLKKIIDIRIKE